MGLGLQRWVGITHAFGILPVSQIRGGALGEGHPKFSSENQASPPQLVSSPSILFNPSPPRGGGKIMRIYNTGP